MRRTVQSTLCIGRATLNSHLSTTCLFRAVFWYISQISTSFLPTVERRSRCCAWDSSTKQRNIHHRRRSSHLSLDCNWCGEKKETSLSNILFIKWYLFFLFAAQATCSLRHEMFRETHFWNRNSRDVDVTRAERPPSSDLKQQWTRCFFSKGSEGGIHYLWLFLLFFKKMVSIAFSFF